MQLDANEVILKKDFMAKRSQIRKFMFLGPKYRGRWFILTPNALKYYEGSIETGPKRLKGEIRLSSVLAVETVNGEFLDNRPYAFQVVYKQNEVGHLDDKNMIYVISVSEDQKVEWIQLIYEACREVGCQFSKLFHRGVWLGRCYSCCSSVNQRSEGCQPTTVVTAKVILEDLVSTRQNKSDGKINNVMTSVLEMKPKLKLNITGSLTDLPSERVAIDVQGRKTAATDDMIPTSSSHVLDDDVSPVESLNNYKWYYYKLSKPKATELLMNDGRDGCFLIRDSSKGTIFSLAILAFNRLGKDVKHYRIRLDANRGYFLSPSHAFQAIPTLVEYHMKNSAGLPTRLKCYPLDETEIYSCFSSIEINNKDLIMKEQLGAGQFGKVHRAIYKHSCEVAVKFLKEKFDDKSGGRSSIEIIEEAKALMLLDHPNLVKIVGICRSKPIKIVTEYLKYGSLVIYLRKNKRALQNDCPFMLRTCRELCSGMKYLEEHHIIHRDLAARNCLVGEKNVVKICDFGLAREVDDNNTYQSSSGALFAIRWTAPEGIIRKIFSTKSDVWSFGVLMWEIFTCGVMPYEQYKSNGDCARAVCNEDLRLQKPDNCPNDVYEIFEQCWQKEPNERPTFGEVFHMLENLLQ